MIAHKRIADRGHGLSRRMRDVLAATASGFVDRDELSYARPSYIYAGLGDQRNGTCTSTIRALHRRGLVEPGQRRVDSRFSTWQLTSTGRTLLDRMGGLR